VSSGSLRAAERLNLVFGDEGGGRYVPRPDSNVRPAQADTEFVAECRMPDAPFAAAFALSVRREVARRAGVEPGAVHAADRLPEEWGDLFVRESLDALEFVMELEGQFGVEIPDAGVALFGRESVGVGELAAGLCAATLGHRGRGRERDAESGVAP
jgi:acyl carrier protein